MYRPEQLLLARGCRHLFHCTRQCDTKSDILSLEDTTCDRQHTILLKTYAYVKEKNAYNVYHYCERMDES